jgi:16S rRNA (guanine527-N7)-methyltransferase
MKGPSVDDELGGLPAGFRLCGRHALHVPGLQAERHLLVLGCT